MPDTGNYPQTRSISSELHFDLIEEASTRLRRIPETLFVPSASVSVGINGIVIWSESIGYANLEKKIPASHETVYRIGNGAKSITSMAIMMLNDRELVDIDAPANDFLPQVPDNAAKFTIRELLSHTAGFGYHNDFGYSARLNSICECLQFNSVDESMSLINGYPLKYNPGEKVRYSTYGYIALSKIVEEITGEPFYKYLNTSIFTPVGAESIIPDHYHGRATDIQKAVSYALSGDTYRKWRTSKFFSHRRNLSYNWAGGGMLATPTDMVRLGNALLTDPDFINFETSAEFISPQKYRNGEPLPDQSAGLGWSILPEYRVNISENDAVNVFMVRSEGFKNGSGNILLLVPEFDFVIDVAINGTGNHFSFQDLWVEVLNLSEPFLREIHKQRTEDFEIAAKATVPNRESSSL